MRVFRLSRIRGKVGYVVEGRARLPAGPRTSTRASTPRAPTGSSATRRAPRAGLDLEPHRLARAAPLRPRGRRSREDADDGVVFETEYADSRQLVSWVLGLGDQRAHPRARRSWSSEARRAARARRRAPHRARPSSPPPSGRRRAGGRERGADDARRDADPPRALRPPGHARGHPDRRRARRAHKLDSGELCERLQITDTELREDIDVLNVVNFGGGSLRALRRGARRHDRGRPRALRRQLRPARAPAAARGEGARRGHRPARRPPARRARSPSAREKIVAALGQRPRRARACRSRPPRATTPTSPASVAARSRSRRLLEIEYYKENEDEFTERRDRAVRPDERPGGLVRALAATRPRTRSRSFRLDRIKSRDGHSTRRSSRARACEPDVHGWPRTGEVPDSRTARVWISPERARWAREDRARGRGADGRRA